MLRPNVQIVALDQCVLHEETDPARVQRLAWRIANEQLLQNPPIVAAHPDIDGLIVLDGATRTTALRSLGMPHGVVHIVDYTDERLTLHCWQHVLPGVAAETLLEAIRSKLGLQVTVCSAAEADAVLEDRSALIAVRGDGQVYRVGTALPFEEHVGALQQLGRLITDHGSPLRIASEAGVQEAHLNAPSTLISYPAYTKEELVAALRAGLIFPAGITRHSLPERVLRMNVPLDALRQPTPLPEKQAWFEGWLDAQWSDQRIRYYPEPTIVFND